MNHMGTYINDCVKTDTRNVKNVTNNRRSHSCKTLVLEALYTPRYTNGVLSSRSR